MSNVLQITPARVRFIEVRPRVRIAGLSLAHDDPFAPLLTTLMAQLLDARTQAERARVALEDTEGEDWRFMLARSTWETAQARSLGFEAAVDVVRKAARKGSRP